MIHKIEGVLGTQVRRVRDKRRSSLDAGHLSRNVITPRPMAGFAGDAHHGMLRIELVRHCRCGRVTSKTFLRFSR